MRTAACDQSYSRPSLSRTTGTVSADFLNIIKHFMRWVHYTEHSSKHCLSCVNCVKLCAQTHEQTLMPASVWASISVGIRAVFLCACVCLFDMPQSDRIKHKETHNGTFNLQNYVTVRVCMWLRVRMNPPVIVVNGWQGGHYTVENICVAALLFFF